MNNFDHSKERKLLMKRKVGIGLVIAVLVIVGWRIWSVKSNRGSENNGTQGTETVSSNLGEVMLDGTYVFMATDSRGNEGSEVNFRLTKAEKTKEVLVKGRPANAKGEKAFLVLHIEIDNPETVSRYLAPVDMLRLVGDDGKKFAPDIHSQVVEIQPISTKITRVGFVVPEKKNNFKLQIGELEGDKDILEINFN